MSLSTNPEPHTNGATCRAHQAWMPGRDQGAGEGAEPRSRSKDTHPSVTSRSRGLWCECPKIPKLGDTPPTPYLPSEERDPESTGRTILVHAAKPRRAGAGIQYPGYGARSSFSHPPACTPLLRTLCGVLRLRTLSHHSFHTEDS